MLSEAKFETIIYMYRGIEKSHVFIFHIHSYIRESVFHLNKNVDDSLCKRLIGTLIFIIFRLFLRLFMPNPVHTTHLILQLKARLLS